VPLVLAVILALLVQGAPQTAAPPRLEDYPVSQIYRGKPAPPDLSTPEARRFRTVLRQFAQGPNFAGHFTLAMWGCGAACSTVAVIDAKSGAVVFAPFFFQGGANDINPACSANGPRYDIRSELLLIQGRVIPADDVTGNGKVGLHGFRWRDGKFTPVYFGVTCSFFE
jgi:hypothetical protein